MSNHFHLQPFLTALFISAVFVLAARRFAPRLGLLDHPTARKQHVGAVPLVGGISIFFGAWVGLWLVSDHLNGFWPPLLATLLILVVGVLDDRHNLSVTPRIVVQTIATLVMVLGAHVSITSLGDLLWIAGSCR